MIRVTPPDRRRWLVSAALVALLLGGVVGTATATPDAEPPLYVEATARPFRHGDVRVQMMRASGPVCVAARKAVERSRTEWVLLDQAGCSEGAEGVRYRRVQGTVRAETTFPTHVITSEYRWTGWVWELVSRTTTRASVTVDLTWRSQLTTGMRPAVSGPGICYSGTMVCYTRARIQRDAVVSGVIHFGGLGVRVPVPSRHPGTLTVG